MRAICFSVILLGILALLGCNNSIFQSSPVAPAALGSVPAVRLNFRYEADVPTPAINPAAAISEERDAAVQADFDTSRPQELLDRTIASPDKKRVLAVYHNVTDVAAEFRLDMYTSEGMLLKKMTSETMAVHFPDTIVWSPDSTSVAFVAMTRALPLEGMTPAAPTALPSPVSSPEEAAPETSAPQTPTGPTPSAPTGILAFRSEQIYISSSEGTGTKAVTENDGLIYFYYAWSPDSTMLAALAATAFEWRRAEIYAAGKGEMIVPHGRLRIIERNGRERRLDDNPTSVRPVWSPDGSKVATAYETQIRIYDAAGINPTQAAIPLKNQLLLSSQAYDRQQQRLLQASNETDANTAVPSEPDQPVSSLPDEKLLVSYNPIVDIAWTADDLLYLQTAFVRRFQNAAENIRSFSRWHRLVLTAQPAMPAK